MRLLCLAAVFLAGCTSTRPFDTRDAGPEVAEARAEINDRGARSAAVVTLASGERAEARSLHVAPDVTTWIGPDGRAHEAPTEDVVAVRFTRRGRGALQGLGIGLGVGAVTGGALGLISGDGCDPSESTTLGDSCLYSDGMLAVVFGTALGVVGAGAGVGVGLLRGSQTVYRPVPADAPGP